MNIESGGSLGRLLMVFTVTGGGGFRDWRGNGLAAPHAERHQDQRDGHQQPENAS